VAGCTGAPASAGEARDANAVYPLGSSPGESARLERQSEELAADSAALLDRPSLPGLGPQTGLIRQGAGQVRRPCAEAKPAEYALDKDTFGI
jgi:hypothetical protein